MRYLNIFLLILMITLISCDNSKTAIIWTDRPEVALYANYYNTVQDQFKVSVRFIESPGAELASNNIKSNSPDIIAASWLKSSSMGTLFRSLDNLFGKNKLSKETFYPKLLAIGRAEKNQYLLPVSFNIPLLVFSKDRENDNSGFKLSNKFTIGFDEIKTLSRPYNIRSRTAFTRMGFSPLWNNNFLFTAAVICGASFREANPLAWDSAALERSMTLINEWTNEINTNTQSDDDFNYKYFAEPPEKLIQSGRILFSYMESDDFFTLSEDSKNNLDFRWIMEQEKIPVSENSVYIGIPKKAKAAKPARAFIMWFFKIENQRSLLEYSRNYRINESSFGICGGFSALTPVTEQIYPVFYPELLGRMPPSENFTLPNILPGNWVSIKQRVVIPYLSDRARRESAEETYALERRLSDWTRLNR